MRKFFVGMVAGAAIACTAPLAAQKMVGRDGYLLGWTVNKDGEEVCSDPWIWTGTMEIDC